MNCCSCSCCGGGEEEHSSFKGQDVESFGPVESRGCTDILCVPIFLLAQVVFVIVTIAGLANGDPTKLYKPRDFEGNYCGFKDNWNSGPNTEKQTFQAFTMNVSSTADVIVKQLVCSSTAKKVLVDGVGGSPPVLSSAEDRKRYMCDCCLTPCEKCSGSLQTGGDLSSISDLESVIKSKMAELTSLTKGSLFDPAGANEGFFSTNAFWEKASEHFHQVCMPDCSYDSKKLAALDASDTREYLYSPSPDDALYSVWKKLLDPPSGNSAAETIKATMVSSFTFKAYSKDICPYDAPFCVPTPGLQFGDVGVGRCTFEMTADVVNAVGKQAATVFKTLGLTSFTSESVETFGNMFGDLLATLDAFCVVALLAFVLGLIYMVLFRFTVGICVWIAVFSSILIFAFGGAFMFVISNQCNGAGFLQTGQQHAVAVFVAGSTFIKDQISGDTSNEYMDPNGDGTDYRGKQHYTKSGKKCLVWDEQKVLPDYTSANYPKSDLVKNFCRNPVKESDDKYTKAKTIWCVTGDASTPWEECTPIGVIAPKCVEGYVVSHSEARTALFVGSFVVWVIGLLWCLFLCCMAKRIRLAIAINKVAAQFVASHPQVVLIPIVQALVAFAWTVLWFYAASFLLSQVSDGYVPTGRFTYAEAKGTSGTCAFWEFGDSCKGTPGKCTGSWPTGFAWRDDECDQSDPPRCWRCAAPRYNLDLRFAVSFFVFLWNNAFNVALGQLLLALCVSMWFFSKGTSRRAVLTRSLWISFRYHLGSVAFGSFIVALVQFIRAVMKYLEKNAAAQKNRVMVCILKVLQCCLWCFEKCIKFLNKNAYIQIALHGKNFCVSAKKAFFLIARNILRFGVMASLSHIVHAIGIVSIVASTMVVGYFIVRAMHSDISPFMPLIAYFVVGVIVGKVYMSVFAMAVDTSLQCFLMVEEAGGGEEFVPSALSSFVSSNETRLKKSKSSEVAPKQTMPTE